MGEYVKHIWERGDTITVDLLNNIENNIATLMDNANEDNTMYIHPEAITNPTTVSSNASTVINATLAKAAAAGKHYVVIPDGEYWLTETVYLKSDVILKGCGMDATTLKIADGCDIDAIRVSEPVNNSGIMDLSIDGNRIENYSVYSSGHHGNAINVWLHYGRIERVRTNWVYKHSLLLNYDTGNSDDGLGFTQEHQNDMGNLNKVLWCDFRDSLLQGIMWGWRTMDSWMCYTNIGSHAANLYLEGGTSRFIGNHFDGDGDNGAGPEYNVYCGDGCKAMVFEGNIFENTQKENIFFRQPSYSNQTMTITIANNIIRTCSKSQNNQYSNIYISGYSTEVPATEIIITGNQILNPDTNANHGYAGVHLAYCENSKVLGNTFFNVGTDTVKLDNTCESILNDGVILEDIDDLEEAVQAKYTLPTGGIPKTDLANSVQASLDKADGIDEITTESYSRYNVLSPEWLPTGTIKNVEITRSDDVFTFTGTANGSDSDFGSDLDLIPGAKYTVKIYTTSTKTINASIRYRNSSNVETNLASFGTSLNTPVTVTVPATYSRIYIKLGVVSGNVYSGETYRISLALGETNPKYEKYGEGTSAYDGYSRIFLNKLNTDLKNISTFATPEQFGAKGNGTSDDTAALNACLTYAITNSIPVFGANTYKVTSAIEIDCDDMLIYIHRINSAASIACALSLTGSRNNLIIDRIYTTNSVGFRLLSTPTRVTQNNYIKSQSIYASGNAIEVYGVPVDNTDATLISYNTFMLNNVQSANGNCIVNGTFCAENQFYNAKLKGENGWGIYEPRAMRCYGFSLESDLLNGIYMSAGCSGTFVGFRHTELTDKLVYRMLGQSGYTGGTLIKILGRFNQQFTYIASQYIPYQAIDTSEIVDYTDPTIDIDPPNDWFAKWTRFNISTRSSIIMGNIRYGMYATQNGGFPLGDNITICAGKKICRPLVESSYTITTADFDMRDDYTSDANCWPWATTFVIDVADCEIHLSPSYCCLGYNKLTIDQSTSGKLCTIYNSYDDDVPIFDGTTLGAGVYTLSCSCDLDAAADQIPGTSNYYTGRNDLWTVRDSTGAIVSTYRYTTPTQEEPVGE